jgi:energy-coupling factor transporter transmembrane protein EcfT
VGPLGYLACGLGSLVSATVVGGWHAALAFLLAVALALLLYPGALLALRRRRFWLFTAILVVSSGLLLTDGGADWRTTGMSLYGLRVGVQMAFRAATILVAVSGILERVGVAQLAAMLERLGVEGLGFALGVALNSLPVIGETARNSLAALRLRGGFRRERAVAVRQLLLTVVTNSLRYGEQVVTAAEARAYSPDRAHPLPLPWSWVDGMLIGGITLAVLGLSLL